MVVQIEHIAAIEVLAEILSVPGVDGYFVGPYDLSCSMGRPGEFSHPEFKAAMDRIRTFRRGRPRPQTTLIMASQIELLCTTQLRDAKRSAVVLISKQISCTAAILSAATSGHDGWTAW